MILDKQTLQGPNAIGIPADKLVAILERAGKRNDNRGKGGRSRNYRGGSRNRSGGSRDRNRSGGNRSRNSSRSGYRGNRD